MDSRLVRRIVTLCGIAVVATSASAQVAKPTGTNAPTAPKANPTTTAPNTGNTAPVTPNSPGSPAPRGIGNDSCATPQAISGTGTFAFNNFNATTGVEGQHAFCDVAGIVGIENDEWFCWTPTCSGLATIRTCGLTQVDTKIALYRGCGCPPDTIAPQCCNDDACGRQSSIQCDVQCGQQYMIQIGKHPGAASGQGSFEILCDGNPCATGPLPECCGLKPSYTDQAYSTFTGQVMIMTGEVQFPAGASDYAVTIFDIQNFGSAPLDSNWNPPNFRYHDARWTKANMGSVFGVTLDDRGNIYAAHTTIYNSLDPVGALPGTTPGSIFKLDNTTGNPAVWVNLPNTGPGLGNVNWDCEHSQMFASNFEDGRIYRISATGGMLSAYDHATGVITPAVAGVIANEAGEPDGNWVPRGERVWAVHKIGDRLYYSLWNRDSRNINDNTDPLPPNQIWSIRLDATGDFIAGTAQLELNMPGHGPYTYSEPVSDISFSPDSPAKMLCAERNMTSDSTSYAHDARLVEFQFSGGLWLLSGANTNVNGASYGMPVGNFSDSTNCAGGADYDREPNGRIWTSGDAMHLNANDAIYGGAGILTAGSTVANDILFDYNGNTSFGDKSQLGDIVIPCFAPPCMSVTDVSVLCNLTNGVPNGTYTATFTVTNNSGVTVNYLLLPNAQTSPHVVVLATPLTNGQSTTVSITLTGVAPQTHYCFDVIMADANIRECCHTQICVDTPACDCIQFPRYRVVCDPATGQFALQFTFQNLRPEVLYHMFLVPLAPHQNAVVTPDYLPLPGIVPGGSFNTPQLGLQNVAPGDVVCFRISVHNDHLQLCCSVVLCVTIPPACSGNGCLPDFNHDGVLNSQDFFEFLAAFFGGQSSSDFDHNGVIDSRDFFTFLAAFFTGCG